MISKASKKVEIKLCKYCDYSNQNGMCWSRKGSAEYGKEGCNFKSNNIEDINARTNSKEM